MTDALPELQDALLDPPTLDALLGDIAALGDALDVRLKGAPGAYATDGPPDLDQVRRLLASGLLRGAQIRYVHARIRWCDTLLVTPAGVRLVRTALEDPPTD